jgi:hypothetical protein
MSKEGSGQFSRKRNLEFKITIQDAWKQYLKQKGKCAISGVDIKLARCYARVIKNGDKKLTQTASLDRIDSSKGYLKNNIQWVHKLINRMKMDMSQNDFFNWCKIIYKYNYQR